MTLKLTTYPVRAWTYPRNRKRLSVTKLEGIINRVPLGVIFTPSDISELLLESGFRLELESLSGLLAEVEGIERLGGKTPTFTFPVLNPMPAAPAAHPLPMDDAEPCQGPVSQRLAKLEQGLSRCEAMLAAMVESLGVTVKG